MADARPTLPLPLRLLALIALALVLALAGCGGDDDDQGEVGGGTGPELSGDDTVQEATVEQILRDPEAWMPTPVLVRGRAYPVGEAGFILEQDGNQIFVAAPYSDFQDLESGEQVRVRGELEQLSDTRAETIEDALDAQAEAAEPERFDELARDIGPDKPILNLRLLVGEQG